MNRLPPDLETHDAKSATRARGPVRPLSIAMLLLLTAVVSTPALLAQQARNFRVVASGGLGGPLDADSPDPGLGNGSFQLGFSWVTQPQARVAVRLGSADLGDALEELVDPSLDWLTVGGEYLYSESYFESGIYLGLGYYRLDGVFQGVSEDDTAVGLVVGATGDFPVNSRFAIVGEVALHWADLDRVGQLFGFAHVGVAFSF